MSRFATFVILAIRKPAPHFRHPEPAFFQRVRDLLFASHLTSRIAWTN
jgi:hypothetical protein